MHLLKSLSALATALVLGNCASIPSPRGIAVGPGNGIDKSVYLGCLYEEVDDCTSLSSLLPPSLPSLPRLHQFLTVCWSLYSESESGTWSLSPNSAVWNHANSNP